MLNVLDADSVIKMLFDLWIVHKDCIYVGFSFKIKSWMSIVVCNEYLNERWVWAAYFTRFKLHV